MLKIRKGTVNNLDELENLYNDSNDYLEENINYPGWKRGCYPVRESAQSGIDDDALYVAEENGKIVGSIILNHKPESAYNKVKWKADYDYSEVFVIHTFVVHPHFLKRNIGYTLMKFAEEEAKRCNIKSIRLDVNEGNIPAINLYEKCGYEYIDTIDLGLSCYGLDFFKVYEKIII